MESDTKAEKYYQFFNQQQGRGADFPVFQGTRYNQYGQGFGNIFRGFFRHVLPVVASGALTFLSELA